MSVSMARQTPRLALIPNGNDPLLPQLAWYVACMIRIATLGMVQPWNSFVYDEPLRGRIPTFSFFRHRITGAIALLSIVASFSFWEGIEPARSLLPDSLQTKPWQLFSATVLHSDGIHLGFNLCWFVLLGSWVEDAFGSWRTLFLFGWLKVAASAVQIWFDVDGIGLSGIVYGLFGMLIVIGRKDRRFRGLMTISTLALIVSSISLDLASSRMPDVAIAAHIGGFAFGLLLGIAITIRGWFRSYFIGFLLFTWTAALSIAMIWPASRPDFVAFQGYHELNNEKFEAAAQLFEKALTIDKNQPHWWRELAYAYVQLNRATDAAEALRCALALKSRDKRYLESLALVQGHLAYLFYDQENFLEAKHWYRESLTLNENNAWAWYGIGVIHHHLREVEFAREAYSRAFRLEPTNNDYRHALENLR